MGEFLEKGFPQELQTKTHSQGESPVRKEGSLMGMVALVGQQPAGTKTNG